MKIAFIGQRGIPAFYSGIERRVEELATRLVQEGHEVTVYVRPAYLEKIKDLTRDQLGKKLNENGPQEYKGVRLVSLPTINTRSLDTIVHSFLATIHAAFGEYDLVHYQAPGPASLIPVFKFFNRFFGGRPASAGQNGKAQRTKIVATFNSRDQFHQKWGFWGRKYLNWAEKVISTAPDATIAGSPLIKQYVKEKFNQEIEFIPNGASIQRTPATGQLEKFALKENRYLLTVNRLVKHKKIDQLIKAFQQLKQEGVLEKDFKLVITGGSDLLNTSEYEKYLRKLAKGDSKKDAGEIIFTGIEQGATLQQLFSHAFAFVQPSIAEGFSTVIIEAMNCGRPLIVSDIGENLAVIGGTDMLKGNALQNTSKIEFETALVFEKDRLESLKEKIKELVNAPLKAETLGERAAQYAHENYDWARVFQKTLAVYEKVMK